jgi:hypothetical protein
MKAPDSHVQQPEIMRSGSPEQPKGGVGSEKSHRWRAEDRKALDAAVSEGWPVPQTVGAANPRMLQPYRTGAQTWLRGKNIRIQP